MEKDTPFEVRQEKLRHLESQGISAYGGRFAAEGSIGQISASFKEGQSVQIAGRITAKREHGKAIFADLKDASGKIQIYAREDIVGADRFLFFANLDLGDIIGVKGEEFVTRAGEPTVKATEIVLLAKSLRPLPEKWHGLKDTEIRYRQRYVDLIANETTRKIFVLRSRIISYLRKFLDEKGFIEVETPMIHAIPGGASGRPFKTHHNEYHQEFYLRIAPELYLKRLLVGGFTKVYEINRSFRNEGVSRRHNPEFTMLELYCAYWDYKDMMEFIEELLVSLVQEVLGASHFSYQGHPIDMKRPWRSISFVDIVRQRYGIAPDDTAKAMEEKLRKAGRPLVQEGLSRTQIVKIIEDVLQEETAADPIFCVDYFKAISPLARVCSERPQISERFELFIAGVEIANAYSEQNDPAEQRRRFEEGLNDLEGEIPKIIDEDYLRALEYGMPPASGLGIGIDRLVMILADQASIRDVILFPLLRPDEEATAESP